LRSAIALAAGLLLTTAGTSLADDAGDIELVNPGTLTMCTHLPYEPFEFVNDERETVGFDVDLTRLLADRLDVDTRVISIAWNQITSGLVFASNKCDIAAGSATITDKRAESVLFSDPYFNLTQVLLVKEDSGIDGLADLEGKKLGVQTATTGMIYAEDHQDEYGYTLVEFEDVALGTTAVSAGRVDAFIQDNAPLYKYAKEHSETTVATEFDTGERAGFMVQKDDANAQRLVDLFNDTLAEAKEDGTYAELYEKWFGQTPPDLDE